MTLDVKSLNTNIPNNEGVEAVTEAYHKQPSKIISTTTTKNNNISWPNPFSK